jgi:hypothetical protein
MLGLLCVHGNRAHATFRGTDSASLAIGEVDRIVGRIVVNGPHRAIHPTSPACYAQRRIKNGCLNSPFARIDNVDTIPSYRDDVLFAHERTSSSNAKEKHFDSPVQRRNCRLVMRFSDTFAAVY